jgi:hypothetical protein
MQPRLPICFARLAIALVFLWNIQCAFAFLFWPSRFTLSFELPHAQGEVIVRGVGLLFLMWNIPCAVALTQPLRHQVSLYEATAIQTIGVLGESLILHSLPTGHQIIHASLVRFLIFDIAGLVLLLLAVWLVNRHLLLRAKYNCI